MPSYKQWVSRSRELSGFRDWAEKLGGRLCLIHDRYGPELREALRMEDLITVLVSRHCRVGGSSSVLAKFA